MTRSLVKVEWKGLDGAIIGLRVARSAMPTVVERTVRAATLLAQARVQALAPGRTAPRHVGVQFKGRGTSATGRVYLFRLARLIESGSKPHDIAAENGMALVIPGSPTGFAASAHLVRIKPRPLLRRGVAAAMKEIQAMQDAQVRGVAAIIDQGAKASAATAGGEVSGPAQGK